MIPTTLHLPGPRSSRRAFLRRGGLALSASGMLNALAQLELVYAQAAQEHFDDYKALVCIYLDGGNDSNNLVIPMGNSSTNNYNRYNAARGAVAIQQADLTATQFNDPAQGNYGLHPSMGKSPGSGASSLHSLAQAGKLAVVANVGTLVEPTPREVYLAGNARTPSQLFSHNDQKSQWQSSVSDRSFQTGWGGRLADELAELVLDGGNPQLSMSTSISGQCDFLVGLDEAHGQLHLTTSGAINLTNFYPSTRNTGLRLSALNNVLNAQAENLLQNEYLTRVKRARENNERVREVLSGLVLPSGWPTFPDTVLGRQLRIVAQMILASEKLELKRQIFFTEFTGFDTHKGLLAPHEALLDEVNQALGVFQRAVELIPGNLADKVTTFTASDFNRTFAPNRSDPKLAGTDHAWGGHALVMGGAVNTANRKIFGTMPDLVLGGQYDTEVTTGGKRSRGRWIPSISVDQYGATLAKWFGVAESRMNRVFPNLGRFDSADLGFMKG